MGGDKVPGIHLLVPFLAWVRGEPCPVCGERPEPEIEKKWKPWIKWAKVHMYDHIHREELHGN